MPSLIPNYLLCHPKNFTDVEIGEAGRVAGDLLATRNPDKPFALVSARDEYLKNFPVAGGWGPWIDRVVTGINFSTRQPNYSGFIATGRQTGKATGEMLARALQAGKEVLVIEPVTEGSTVLHLGQVRRSAQVTASYLDGWWLEY